MSDEPTPPPDDPTELPEGHLEGLAERFMAALEARERHDVDAAAELLRGVLKGEPRLAEPRMELARVLLDTDQPEEAEAEAREAIALLEAGGQWTEELPENVVLGLAYDILGECIRQQVDRDDAVFGDPEAWQARVLEARRAFAKAAALDPDNEHARWMAGEFSGPGQDGADDGEE